MGMMAAAGGMSGTAGNAVSAGAAPLASLIGAKAGQEGAFGSKNTFQGQSAPLIKQDFIPQINQSYGRTSGVYDQQQALANALMAQSQGQGPSLAQMQLQDATNRNIQQGAGMISSQKGINPALAARLIANQTANSNQTAAGQSAQARLLEQMQARQQLGGLYNQMGTQQLDQQKLLQQALMGQNQAVLSDVQGLNQIGQNTAKMNAEWGQKLMGGVTDAFSMKGMQSGGGKGGGGAGGMGGSAGGDVMSGSEMVAAHGGVVPGQAEVSGDSVANDKVKALLSPGEIVIPRTAAQDPDKAKAFIDEIKKSKSGSKEPSYGSVLEAHRKLAQRVKELEQQLKGA